MQPTALALALAIFGTLFFFGAAPPSASASTACQDVICIRSSDRPYPSGGRRVYVYMTRGLPGATHYNVRVGGGKQFEVAAGVSNFEFHADTRGDKQFSMQSCKRGGAFSSSTCSKWVTFTHTIPPAPGTVQVGTDMPGGDYKNFDLASVNYSECRTACQNDGKCGAWTFVKAGVQGPKARCWLKARPQPMRANMCCVSGVK